MKNNYRALFVFTAASFSIIRKNFKPTDIFFEYQLHQWAKEHGYVKPTIKSIKKTNEKEAPAQRG